MRSTRPDSPASTGPSGSPTGTPREAIQRLHGDTVKALATPDIRERLGPLGFDIIGSTPEAYAETIRVETERWAKIIRDSGAKAD